MEIQIEDHDKFDKWSIQLHGLEHIDVIVFILIHTYIIISLLTAEVVYINIIKVVMKSELYSPLKPDLSKKGLSEIME